MLSSPNQINWLRVEEDVPPHAVVTGSDLYIENLNKSYNGTYRCVASNSVGEAYDDYVLYVYGRCDVMLSDMKVFNVIDLMDPHAKDQESHAAVQSPKSLIRLTGECPKTHRGQKA